MTLLLDSGVPPHVVRDIVGHRALDVTVNVYAHVSLDEKQKAMTKLADRAEARNDTSMSMQITLA